MSIPDLKAMMEALEWFEPFSERRYKTLRSGIKAMAARIAELEPIAKHANTTEIELRGRINEHKARETSYERQLEQAKEDTRRLRGLLKEASLYVRTMLDEEIDKEIERQKDGIATDFDEPMVNLLHRIDAASQGGKD